MIPLHRSATFALELARQPDGYLTACGDVVDELRDAGLITAKPAGDGFVIIKAALEPRIDLRRNANGRWVRRSLECRA